MSLDRDGVGAAVAPAGTPPTPPPGLSRAWRWTAALAGVFSLGGLALGVWQAEALGRAWQALGAGTLAATVALCWLNYLLRGVRWWAWLRHDGAAVPLPRALRLYLAAYAFTATPGNVGEALRGAWVRPGQTGWALGIFGAERVADLLALLLLAAGALPLLIGLAQARGLLTGPGGMALPAGLGAAALLVAGLAWAGLRRWRARPGARLPGWLRDAGRCLRVRPAVWLGLSLAAWAAQGGVVWLLARDLGLSLDAATATGVYAVAMIGGALSALPAGLGSMEALLAALLVAAGASLAPALVLVLLVRVLTLWQAIVAGALILGWSLWVLKDPKLA